MAIPKVFISSTCFDLKEVRDSLSRFIKNFGFDPILSEHGDVFYHPDLHTHEACIHEISNCQLFILIIGGRFGGNYVHDKEQSITNAEYSAAKEINIPIFTYIKQGVLDNHHTYQANKNKEFIKDMEFPNIERQEHSLDIFNFIDHVRKANTNNAFETFETTNEIEIHLRKQWAGMFFDYLKNREVKEQVNAANVMLATLQTSSEKFEEMIKGLYGPEENTLDNIENKYVAIKFFELVLDDKYSQEECYLGKKEDLIRLSNIDPKNKKWYDYLIELGSFEKLNTTDGDVTLKFTGIGYKSSSPILKNAKNEEEIFEKFHEDIVTNFEHGVQKLNLEERKKVLQKFVI